MKTTTWNRDHGFVRVVLFDNGTSAAVSTKQYKTEAGAIKANEKLQDICGDGYSKQNLPYRTTDPKTGEVVVNYRVENLTSVQMQHRIEDYTDSDLTVASSSPFNTQSRQDELEAEYQHRKYDRQDKYKH